MYCAFVVVLCFLWGGAESRWTNPLAAPGRTLKAPRCNKEYKGTGWNGKKIHDGPMANVENWEECCRQCEYAHGCIAYFHKHTVDTCELLSSVTTPFSCPECSGRNEAEKRPHHKCDAKYDEDIPDGDLEVTSTQQPGDCCDRCGKTPNCVAWVWKRDTHGCVLKSELNQVVKCHTCIRGNNPQAGR